jgi:hypothetical protein
MALTKGQFQYAGFGVNWRGDPADDGALVLTVTHEQATGTMREACIGVRDTLWKQLSVALEQPWTFATQAESGVLTEDDAAWATLVIALGSTTVVYQACNVMTRLTDEAIARSYRERMGIGP